MNTKYFWPGYLEKFKRIYGQLGYEWIMPLLHKIFRRTALDVFDLFVGTVVQEPNHSLPTPSE